MIPIPVPGGTLRAAVLLLLLLLLGGERAASAQGGGSVGGELENAGRDMLHVWSSPLRVGASDLPVLIGVAEAVLLTAVFDEPIQEWIREHPDALPVRALAPLREPEPLSYLGRSFALQPLSALLYAAGHAWGRQTLREAGIGCATANISNSLSRHLIGRLSGRLRPMYGGGAYDVDPLAWSEWPRRSFPNGHGSNIMACASFWNHRFDLGAGGPLLYALALAVGAARITSEAHWASDTVFGAIYGWGVGRAVAERFDEREADELRAREGGEPPRPTLYLGWRVPVP